MERGSVVFSKCENALSGVALLVAELTVAAEFATPPDDDELVLGASALAGGLRVFAAGTYDAELVSAFDPAEDDPADANDDVAPAPVVPADALDWM